MCVQFQPVNLKGPAADRCLHESTFMMTNHPSSVWTSGGFLVIHIKNKVEECRSDCTLCLSLLCVPYCYPNSPPTFVLQMLLRILYCGSFWTTEVYCTDEYIKLVIRSLLVWLCPWDLLTLRKIWKIICHILQWSTQIDLQSTFKTSTVDKSAVQSKNCSHCESSYLERDRVN